MTLIRTSAKQRLNIDNRLLGCPAFSAGQFVLRADGTGRFDRHYHDFAEFWFVAAGSGTVLVGDASHEVTPGDIIYTAPGQEHDITAVIEQLHIFWLSLALPPGSSGAHLHRRPELAVKHLVPVASRQQPGDE
jgi:mannose-6-phosphate isomerase-like protein (cupin superfamily)